MSTRGLSRLPVKVTPGVHFESGDCFLFCDFDAQNPTGEAFTLLWHIAPDDERTLYASTDEACRLFEALHGKQHHAERCAQTFTWEGKEKLSVAVKTNAGRDFRFQLSFGKNAAVRFLEVLLVVFPKALLHAGFMLHISKWMFNGLLSLGGVKLHGLSETGMRYVTEANAIGLIEAQGSLDGKSFGKTTRPTRSISRLDSIVPNRGVMVFGALHFEIPKTYAAQAPSLERKAG